MKQILSAAILLTALLFANYSKGQLLSGDPNHKDTTLPKTEFGLKIGSNTEAISGNFWENKYSTGITGGFWARMHKNKIGVRIEALVSTYRVNSGTLLDSNNVPYVSISDTLGNRGDFRAVTLEVPLVFEYSATSNLLIQVGVQYSNLMSLNNLTKLRGNFQDVFKQGEFSGVIGLEVKLPYNFSVGGRYRYGFSDVNNKEVTLTQNSWKTNAFQLYACYKIK